MVFTKLKGLELLFIKMVCRLYYIHLFFSFQLVYNNLFSLTIFIYIYILILPFDKVFKTKVHLLR